MKTIAKQIGIILLVSGMVSALANMLHPRRIPWMQNWSRQVEEQAAKQKIDVIPLAVALEKFKAGNNFFVDARSNEDFAKGHISGAVSIPFENVDQKFSTIIELIDGSGELVVYCSNRECDDALLLAIELQAIGASNLVLYIDGFDLWKKHGGATASSPLDNQRESRSAPTWSRDGDTVPPNNGATP